MITVEDWAEIRRLHRAEGMGVRAIARHLDIAPVVDQGATYCYLQGTSMAGPHVAGVAALIRSQHPDLSVGTVAARLQQATNPLPCPDVSIYAPFPQNSGEPQSCQGGTNHNSFSTGDLVGDRRTSRRPVTLTTKGMG